MVVVVNPLPHTGSFGAFILVKAKPGRSDNNLLKVELLEEILKVCP